MSGFPADPPLDRVLRALQVLGFEVVRRGNHVSLRRLLADGTIATLTLPGRRTLRSSTLRTALQRAGISRDDFLAAWARS